MKELAYSEIIRKNRELAREVKSEPFKILLLSNTVIANLKDFIEYDLLVNGINAQVELGEFDNIMQSSFDIQHNVLIIFYEAWNIYPGFYTDIPFKDNSWFQVLEEKIKTELTTLFKNASHLPLVVMNKFSSLLSYDSPFDHSPYVGLMENLNRFLIEFEQENLTVFDTNPIFNEISLQKSISYKHFQIFNTLYTNDFFRAYSFYLKFIIFDVAGKTKKVLVMDCDNTLWKGIVGEDGIEQLKMNWDDPAGRPYFEIQKMTKALAQRGVLIALCSKNNVSDVENVFRKHPDMILKEEDVSIMKINWSNKPDNLKEIADELNVNIDSIVFWDDSAFETEMVQEIFPQVTTFQVPGKTEEYPAFFRKQMGWFYRKNVTSEDLKKTQMLKTQIIRENQRKAFLNIDEYLSSLQLKIHIEPSPQDYIDRISQLTQKTNQFNLSIKRYTPTEIHTLLNGPSYETIPFRVTDHFGDYGLIGLAIILYMGETAYVDTFLLSCRVLGRNIEYRFWNFLMGHFKKRGILNVKAQHLKTDKNGQISLFFDSIGFQRENETEHQIDYFCSPDNYIHKEIDYITIQS